MIEFLREQGGTIAVGALVAAIIVLTLVKLVRDKKAGKHCCGGDCKSCGCGCRCRKEDDK